MTKIQNEKALVFELLVEVIDIFRLFEFVSSFDIRISDLFINARRVNIILGIPHNLQIV